MNNEAKHSAMNGVCRVILNTTAGYFIPSYTNWMKLKH